MTFLELLNRYFRECSIPSVQVESVADATGGDALQGREWIVDAWRDLQNEHRDWRFLRATSQYSIPQFATVLTPTEFTARAVRDWIKESFRLAPVGGTYGQSQPFRFVEYETFMVREAIQYSSSYGQPQAWTIRDSDHALLVAPGPDVAGYNLYYDYQRAAQTLVVDTDVPIIPARDYDMVVVYEAMLRYGYFDAAPEVIRRAERSRDRMVQQLNDVYGPRFSLGFWV